MVVFYIHVCYECYDVVVLKTKQVCARSAINGVYHLKAASFIGFLGQKRGGVNVEWFFVLLIFTWAINLTCLFLFCIQVAFELVVNDNLGLMIRGGIEYGLGIYITGVDEESAAFRNGLRVRYFKIIQPFGHRCCRFL